MATRGRLLCWWEQAELSSCWWDRCQLTPAPKPTPESLHDPVLFPTTPHPFSQHCFIQSQGCRDSRSIPNACTDVPKSPWHITSPGSTGSRELSGAPTQPPTHGPCPLEGERGSRLPSPAPCSTLAEPAELQGAARAGCPCSPQELGSPPHTDPPARTAHPNPPTRTHGPRQPHGRGQWVPSCLGCRVLGRVLSRGSAGGQEGLGPPHAPAT